MSEESKIKIETKTKHTPLEYEFPVSKNPGYQNPHFKLIRSIRAIIRCQDLSAEERLACIEAILSRHE